MLQSELGPSELAIFFLLSILYVVPSVWSVFGFIFSTRDLRRNLHIWWRVCTTSNDVIFTSNVPSCQVAIYWILKIRFFFLSQLHQKYFFSKVRLIPDSTRSDLSKEPIKVSTCVKMRKKRNYVTIGPKRQVHYIAPSPDPEDLGSWPAEICPITCLWAVYQCRVKNSCLVN